MVSRRDLKGAHENAILRQFGNYLKDRQLCLTILEKPDPPDAIVMLNGNRIWIEIADAFLDQDHAIGLTSGTSDDVEHMPDDGRLIVEPDATFSSVLHGVIECLR